jgi:hypothetical protein
VGRIPLGSYRLNCRVSKRAGEILEGVFDRISYGRKKPKGEILSRLILKTPPETWEAIIKTLPAKTWGSLTEKEFKRRVAERQIKATREESSG